MNLLFLPTVYGSARARAQWHGIQVLMTVPSCVMGEHEQLIPGTRVGR
jgi:hypothetical protein